MDAKRKKGDGKGRIGGRKPGTPNKVTAVGKEILIELISNNKKKVSDMLDKIDDPKDWLNIYLKMCEFVFPKMAAVQVNGNVKTCDLKSELMEMAESEE